MDERNARYDIMQPTRNGAVGIVSGVVGYVGTNAAGNYIVDQSHHNALQPSINYQENVLGVLVFTEGSDIQKIHNPTQKHQDIALERQEVAKHDEQLQTLIHIQNTNPNLSGKIPVAGFGIMMVIGALGYRAISRSRRRRKVDVLKSYPKTNTNTAEPLSVSRF